MDFKLKHDKTGEFLEISIPDFEIQELLSDYIYDIAVECDCEPIGETNVVECNCMDFLEGYRLEPRDK